MKHIAYWKSLFVGPFFLATLSSSKAQPHLILQSNHMVVAGGYLNVPGGQIRVQSGATMTLHESSTTVADSVQIDAGGFVHGCGTLMADVLNYGLLAADCGTGTGLTLIGNVTNHRTIRASHDSALIANSGAFTNHGTLDLLTGVSSLPSMLINDGLIYTATSPPVPDFSFEDDDVALVLSAPSGHSYQLQGRFDLTSGIWDDIGAAQMGNDGSLIFVHTDGRTFDRYFYRYQITD